MKLTKKQWLLVGGVIVSLLLTYYVATVLVPRTLVTMTKAAPSQKVSLSNSYILGSKILARADGLDKCVVNVFILDASGKGIPGKQVEMTSSPTTESTGVLVTDSDGKVKFELSSEQEGQITIGATVDGSQLPRELKVTFRK